MRKKTTKLKCVVCTTIFQSHFNSVEKSCNHNKLDIILNQLFDLFCRHVLSPQSIKKFGFKVDLTRRKKDENNLGSISQHNFPFCPTCRDQIASLSILKRDLKNIQNNILKIVINLISKILKSDAHSKTKTKENSIRESNESLTGHIELTSRLHNDSSIESDRLEKLREVIVKEWRPIIKLQKLPNSFPPQNDDSCPIKNPGQVPETSLSTPLTCESETENVETDIYSPIQLLPSPHHLDSINLDIDIDSKSLTSPLADEQNEQLDDQIQNEVDTDSGTKTKTRSKSGQDQLLPSSLSANGNTDGNEPIRKEFTYSSWVYDCIMSIPNTFECHTCGVITDNEMKMWRHIQNQHHFIFMKSNVESRDWTWPTCPVCKLKFRTEYSLARHVRKTHPTGIDLVWNGENEDAHSVECSPGQFAFGIGQEGKTLAYKTIEDPTNGHGFECLICQIFIPSHSHMAQHFRNCHNPRRNKHQRNPKRNMLIAVVRSMDGKLMFDGKWPFEKLTLNENTHQLKGTGTDGQLKSTGFKCGTCGHIETGWTKFRIHIKHQHEIEQFVCDACGKSFLHRDNFNHHRKLHGPTKRKRVHKKVLCDVCGKPCSSQQAFAAHRLRFHSDPSQLTKKHACTKCPKQFLFAESLKKHQLCHSQEQKFLCADCPKKFKFPGALHRHRKSSHSVDGLKPYPCPHCSKRFTQQQSAARHVKYVHDSKRESEKGQGVRGSGKGRKRKSRARDSEEVDEEEEETQESSDEEECDLVENEN